MRITPPLLCITLLLAALPAGAATVFSTGFEYAGGAPIVGTTAANLNGADGQIGTWSSSDLPAGNGLGEGGTETITFPSHSGTGNTFLLADRALNDFTLSATLTTPVSLAGAEVSFDLRSRRGGNTVAKLVRVIGVDSLGSEAFHLLIRSRNVPLSSLHVISDDGATNSDLGSGIVQQTTADHDSAFDLFTLSLTATGYHIALNAVPLGGAPFAYNQAPIDLARVDIFSQGGATTAASTGYRLDNLVVQGNSTLVPLPPAVWLFAGAGICLVCRARKTP